MLTCNYIGTMYPDYLQDHHNREGEILLCASARLRSIADIKSELLESICNYEIPYTDKEIMRAINAEFRGLRAKDINAPNSDESYIYAYLEWEIEPEQEIVMLPQTSSAIWARENLNESY